MTVPHPLRTRREAACLSQIALAVQAGVSLRTISAIERWEYIPRSRTRRKILKVLEIPYREHYEIFGVAPRTEEPQHEPSIS